MQKRSLLGKNLLVMNISLEPLRATNMLVNLKLKLENMALAMTSGIKSSLTTFGGSFRVLRELTF